VFYYCSFLQNRFLRLPSEDETILIEPLYRTLIYFSITHLRNNVSCYQLFPYQMIVSR